MMKKIIISASAVLLLFCTLAVFFLLSRRGLQFSVHLISFLTENRISIESTTGRLIGPINLEWIPSYAALLEFHHSIS